VAEDVVTDADLANRSQGSFVDDARSRIGGNFQVVLLILIFCSFFWFSYQTRLVSNYDNETSTLLYTAETEQVPLRNISVGESAFFASLFMLFVFMWGKDSFDRPLTPQQSRMEVYKYIEEIRRTPKFDRLGRLLPRREWDVDERLNGNVLITPLFEQHVDSGDGMKPTEHVFGVTCETDAGEFYWAASVHHVRPGIRDFRKGYVSRFLERDSPLDEEHTCAHKGDGQHRYQNIKYVASQEARNNLFMQRELSRARKGR